MAPGEARRALKRSPVQSTGLLEFLAILKEQVCVFVTTNTSRMPSAPGKLASCARWLHEGKTEER
jgi:hypothetical protein